MNLKTFMNKFNLKNESTNGGKIMEVANKLGLKDFGIYLQPEKLTTKQGIINLSNDPTHGTHWVAFCNNFYYDSFCVEPPDSVKNHLGSCEAWISSYPIQKVEESNCASYCLHFLYLMTFMSFHEAIINHVINRHD